VDAHQVGEAFTVWAAVVGMIGIAIVWELARLRAELRAMSTALSQHIVQTEHRLTVVESDLRILQRKSS